MRGTAEVDAPAKVNLVLRILQRRDDGFHEIETIFQAVSLADHVVVSVGEAQEVGREASDASGSGGAESPGGVVHLQVDGPDLGPTESNLAVRAAHRFRELAGLDEPVRIELTKAIPAGAGLGGGSSDAAAVLKCLARITGFDDADALHAAAAELGSDVPFFLAASPLALGRGRGEELTELVALPRASLVLALPDVHVATGRAYADLAARRAEEGPVNRSSVEVPASWDDIAGRAHNDFEDLVVARHPEVARSLEGIRARGARIALLSGSGAASFGLFSDHGEAVATAAWLEGRHPWRFLPVTTRTTMPLPTLVETDG